MRWLLNLIYLGLLAAFSPLLLYRAIRVQKYREGWGEKLLGLAPKLDQSGLRQCDSTQMVWLHAVSMGEVHLLEPLVREIRERKPGWQCVISTTTKSGAEAAARKFPDLVRFYCPLDFTWAVDSAMRRIQPDLLILSELELWPNLIESAKRANARVAIVNGRLSDNSLRGYQRVAWLAARVLRSVDLVCAQNATYAERFRAIGAGAVVETGSIKFDGAITDRNNQATLRLRQMVGLRETDRVFLAGSTQDPEEQLAVDAFLQLEKQHPELQLWIAPRHPERFDDVASLLNRSGVCFQRRTELDSAGSDGSRVLLLDAMGELRAWWGLCDIAYVGGSMGKREGQNMIEPAAYGAAVSFGPRTANFRDVVNLLQQADAATVVASGEQLTAFVRDRLKNQVQAREQGDRAQQVVLSQLGAAAKTTQLLSDLLEPGASQLAAA